MSFEIDINQMSVSEKLLMMELLWDDLCQTESEITSPLGHESVLLERKNIIRDGNDDFIDWDRAKQELRLKI